MTRLRFAGIGIYILSSAIIAMSIVGFITPTMRGSFSYMIIMVSVGILGILIGMVVTEYQRRGLRTVEMIDWQRKLRGVLEHVHYPLKSNDLEKLGVWLTSIFKNRLGWILLVNVPGLLLSGEVHRNKYIRVSSPVWPESLSSMDNLLREEMEQVAKEVNTIRSIDNFKVCMLVSKRNDISVGLAVVLKESGASKFRLLEYQYAQSGVEEVVQYFHLLLGDLVRRRDSMGKEGPGLIIRFLTHEMAGELQGAMNKLDNYLRRQERRSPEPFFYPLSGAMWRVKYLLEQLRDAPVFEDGWLPINPEPIDLMDVVGEIIGEANNGWPDINFILDAPEGATIYVMADSHLRSIVRNLIYNAASFSPDDGIVSFEITLKNKGDFVLISVEDEGPGVTPEQAKDIFDPLVSTSKQRDKLVRRTGVGLAVARLIARAYGGDVVAISSKENIRSSRFEVLLPTAIHNNLR